MIYAIQGITNVINDKGRWIIISGNAGEYKE